VRCYPLGTSSFLTIFKLSAFAGIATVIALSSCSKSDETTTTTTPTTPTLYEQVGGTTKVTDPADKTKMIEKGRLTLRSVVDSAIYVIAADSRMTDFFPTLLGEVKAGNTTGFAALSKNFTDFLAVATGSKTTTYAGKSMKAAHDPKQNSRMGIVANSQDFDKFIGDIGVALNKNGVASSTKLYADLAALLYTTKGDIIQTNLYDEVGGTTLVADPANPGQMIEAGRKTLRSVVDTAIYVIAADPKMAPFFPTLLSEVTSGNTTGFKALSKNFTEFLAVATGSKTITYSGKSMKAAHDPAQNSRMAVKASSADFDAFLADVGKSLVKNGVLANSRTYGNLVDLLNTTKGDIVQK